MARLPSFNYNNPAPSHATLAPNHQARFEDDTDNVLDDNILDCPDSAAMTPAVSHDQRRSSFPHPQAGPLYSPRTGRIVAFPPYPANPDPSQFFYEQEPQSFPHADVAQTQFAYAGWQSQNTPDSLTPTPVYESHPTYETKDHALTYNHDSNQQMYGGLPVEPGALFQSNTAVTASPQSAQDWSSNASNDHLDLQSVPKHIGLASPIFNPNPPLQRRDGIRKKNARFEIPAERTLRTIDQLITQTNDETEIKELKQQKRLLRNRQAALDSRQRKKQHTERLEEEKKQTTTVLNELEEALSEMRLREHEWDQQRNSWQTTQQQYKQYIDELLMEKEEMIRCHTLETADLRKKNSILTEQAQKLESTAMSAVPSSAGFSSDFSEFDHLTMESSPWDNFSMVNDFSMETEPKQDSSLAIVPKKEKSASSKDDDKSATSGLLLMLLLCGAWVASSNTPITTASIPKMPADVRAASAAVLDNIYKDAGLQPTQAAITHTQPTNTGRKTSSRSSTSSKTTISASEFATLSQPAYHYLTAPTEQQTHDQAFALTPTQWNNLTTDPSLDTPTPRGTSPPHRRNLNEALASMRKDKSSAAEVYTRSLMWDEVPTNVVRDFARMVAEANSGGRMDGGEPMS